MLGCILDSNNLVAVATFIAVAFPMASSGDTGSHIIIERTPWESSSCQDSVRNSALYFAHITLNLYFTELAY